MVSDRGGVLQTSMLPIWTARWAVVKLGRGNVHAFKQLCMFCMLSEVNLSAFVNLGARGSPRLTPITVST